MTWRARDSLHTAHGLWSTFRRTFARPEQPKGRFAQPARDDVLDRACAELRNGHLRVVEGLLEGAGAWALTDAACVNLLGVVCETRRHWTPAKRYYRLAMRADPQFQPAQQNMRRMYELETFGRSMLPPATGHLLTDLCLARPGGQGIVS